MEESINKLEIRTLRPEEREEEEEEEEEGEHGGSPS